MATATIDTLEIAQELRRAGVPEPQAEAIAHVFKRRYNPGRDEPITRSYLDASQAKLAAELRAEIVRLERDLVLKMTGIVTATVAIVGALGILF